MTGMAVRVAYGCRNYDINRLCRYDRRALDRKCDGCQRMTDRDYLESQGLWIIGISHQPLPRRDGMDALRGERWPEGTIEFFDKNPIREFVINNIQSAK